MVICLSDLIFAVQNSVVMLTLHYVNSLTWNNQLDHESLHKLFRA